MSSAENKTIVRVSAEDWDLFVWPRARTLLTAAMHQYYHEVCDWFGIAPAMSSNGNLVRVDIERRIFKSLDNTVDVFVNEMLYELGIELVRPDDEEDCE